MFKKLFGRGNEDDQDEYIRRVQEMNRIVQSDLHEDDKRKIVTNMNEDIEEDYK